MTAYPHLGPSTDAIFLMLWRAKGQVVSYDDLYASYRPGLRFANQNTCMRANMKRLRAAFRECGYPDFVVTHPGIGYSLDMAKAPTYRHQIDRIPRQDAARGALTIVPLPDSGPELEPTCWLSNRFLRRV